MNNKHLLILPRYTSKGPSSRVRFYQYLPFLKAAGFSFDVYPFFNDAYIDALFNHQHQNIFKIFTSYFQRVSKVLKKGRYDLIWMQYELLPFIPYQLEHNLLKGSPPLVIDYDDAVFHRYDTSSSWCVRACLSNKIYHIMESASTIICGNDYLAKYAVQTDCDKVEILPSVVDTQKYHSRNTNPAKATPFRIGWIGTPMTVYNLLIIEKAIIHLLQEGYHLVIIGAKVPNVFLDYPVESVTWSPEVETHLSDYIDVGIMPLKDAPFERGKCGYKLIQYMACGLPLIASSVGVNQKIVKQGENGFLATTETEWVEAIKKMKGDPAMQKRMGKAGRKLVEERYDLEKNAQKLINILN